MKYLLNWLLPGVGFWKQSPTRALLLLLFVSSTYFVGVILSWEEHQTILSSKPMLVCQGTLGLPFALCLLADHLGFFPVQSGHPLVFPYSPGELYVVSATGLQLLIFLRLYSLDSLDSP